MPKKQAKIKYHHKSLSVKHRYDETFKRLLQYPFMIEDLIKNFVPKRCSELLDFSTLRPLDTAHTTANLRTRRSDIIWLVDFKDKTYSPIVFPIECQSSPDNTMPIRNTIYNALIQESLIKILKIKNGRLPRICNIVYYVGKKPWTAPTALNHCLDHKTPAEWITYLGKDTYKILDVARSAVSSYTPAKDVISCLIAIEAAKNREEVQNKIMELAEILTAMPNEVRKDVQLYLDFGMKLDERFPEIKQNQEDNIMLLATKIEQWNKESRQEGLQEGRQKGLQEGRQEGIHQERLSIIMTKLKKEYASVPKAVERYLEHATNEELNIWIRQIMNEAPLEAFVDQILCSSETVL